MSNNQDGCRLCRAVKTKYRNQSTDVNFFIVHATRDIVKASSSSEKIKILDQVSTRVSALRNNSGGALIVHLEGQQERDRSLQYFDQCFSERLTNLIEDGEQYTSVYKRLWLNRLPDFGEQFEFVLVKVKRSTSVATIDTKTKLRNDHENLTPSTLHILNLLSQSSSRRHYDSHVDRVSLLFPKAPKIRGLKVDPQEFQEDRDIEHKSIWPRKPETLEKIENSETELVNYLWSDLKLRDNVTSMSKIQEGGSVFFGVVEIKDPSTESPRPVVHGFIKVLKEPNNTAEIKKLTSPEELKRKKKEQGKKGQKVARNTSPPVLQIKIDEEKFRESFEEKIRSQLTFLADGRFSNVDPWRLIQIAFHDVPGYSQQSKERRVVLEVAIAYTTGVIFYDKLGPKTYEIKDNAESISRMDKEQWLKKLSKLYDLLGSRTILNSRRRTF